jgi:hypothetical protein
MGGPPRAFRKELAVSRITTLPVRRIALAAVVLFCVAHRGSTAAAAAQGASPAAQATCVFTNPAYSGKCVETTSVQGGSSAQQSCEVILQCLNNVDCLKTYCQATTVRTGWKLESAK